MSQGKCYVPRPGTGNRTIMEILYEAHLAGRPAMSREVLIRKAEDSGKSNTSFTRPDPGNYYTAWSGLIPALVKKHKYVRKVLKARNRYARDMARLAYYQLTEIGIRVYKEQILGEVDPADADQGTIGNFIQQNVNQIVLNIDHRETPQGQKDNKDRREEFVKHLQLKKDIYPFSVKTLDVGDFLWTVKASTGEELVLDYIVERKRMDDLEGSVNDRRYECQKAKMMSCGIKNLIYLIEDDRKEMLFKEDDLNPLKRSLGYLRTKINETQMHDGFYMVRTRSPEETAIYLQSMTAQLENMFSNTEFVPVSAPNNGGSIIPEKDEFNVIPVISMLMSGLDREIRSWEDLAVAMKQEPDLCGAICMSYEEEAMRHKGVMLKNTYGILVQLLNKHSTLDI